MDIFNLISRSIKADHIELPAKPVIEICAITGNKTLCVLRKKLLSNNFTEQSKLQCPESSFVGIESFQSLKYPKERKSSWLVTKNEFRSLKRTAIRPLVLNGVESELWSGWVTTSYKKHGTLRAAVNTAGQAFWAFDEMLVDCSDIAKVNDIYNRLVRELEKGFGRKILETLNCPVFIISKIGMLKWLELEKWAKPLYKSGLYKFLCYLLPSMAELKKQGWINPIKNKCR
ncbi:hypothetical protein KAR91_75470 [Candidatus Pacearchaeota archaeon]|nr:hypothetical protein [Candidatus Pacearchaeota archaeon]